ncbi:MAG: bifunctional phosphopantothenoylcysteine decarboxylase/phosphopantothenate--cysteine ligase CoaBC [Oscillospiraceae bacterium]
MLKGRNVVLGITGGIAAYKAASLASMLKKQHCNVDVIMTKNACNFITPNTFEALTGNRCITDTFDRNHSFEIEHISLAKKADYFMIAPASANIIGKIANGIADDMLSTTVMACRCPVAIAPAMNTNMYENPIVRDNIAKLEKFGYTIIDAASGYLACGDTGAGKLPEPAELYAYIERELAYEKDMKGMKVLVTAGATQEAIDPVRYITNHSSGKMGYAIAKACISRGAEVKLISGRTALEPIRFAENIPVVSAHDMAEAVKANYSDCDIIIKAAAVADYTPKNYSDSKIKKSDDDMSIPLERTEDILSWLGKNRKDNQFICGFSMETDNLIENSRKKLVKKNVDMIACNSIKQAGAGFQTDTNILTFITEDKEIPNELMSKEMAAHKLIDFILSRMKQ